MQEFRQLEQLVLASGLAPINGSLSSRTTPHSWTVNLLWVFLKKKLMCPCVFHISVMVYLDLRKLSLDIFWFSSQRFTDPPVPLITFFIFVKTSWAFEAVITPLLHGYHSWFWFCHLVCASILEIFSLLMNVFNFRKNLSWTQTFQLYYLLW